MEGLNANMKYLTFIHNLNILQIGVKNTRPFSV